MQFSERLTRRRPRVLSTHPLPRSPRLLSLHHRCAPRNTCLPGRGRPGPRRTRVTGSSRRAQKESARRRTGGGLTSRRRRSSASATMGMMERVAKEDRAAVPCRSAFGGFFFPFPLRYFSISLSAMYFISVFHDSILKSATGLKSNPFLYCTQRERNGFTHPGGYLPQRLEVGEYNKCKVFRLRSPLLND